MAISSIGYQPNFTGKATTYKGNEYEKTNNGKFVGAGAGAVLSGVMVPLNLKRLKSEKFVNFMKDMFESTQDLRPEKTFEEYLKKFNKQSKIALGVMTAITIGIGLGIGAMIDNKKNNNRAYKADMDAKKAAEAAEAKDDE